MPTLTDIRDRIRKDLHDTDAGSYRWTDSQLDRHIDHAMSELSAAMPQEKSATVALTPGSRDVSLASYADLIAVETVEYPLADFPPAYVGFSTWAATLTIQSEAVPTGGSAKLYYTARHTADGSGTTLSPFQVDVLATGAGAYAALEQSAFNADRITTGKDVDERYAAYARARLTAFRQLLLTYGRANRVRQRRLFTPA